jgi:hypothetical protein
LLSKMVWVLESVPWEQGMIEKLKRLNEEIPELNQLYKTVELVRSEEIVAANKGTKTSHIRMRVFLSEVSKAVKVIRQKLLRRQKNL